MAKTDEYKQNTWSPMTKPKNMKAKMIRHQLPLIGKTGDKQH